MANCPGGVRRRSSNGPMMDFSTPTTLKIARAAFVIMLAALLGRVLGFLKEVLVAAWFGTSTAMDAFVIALIVPSVLANLIGGAIQASLVPVYIECRLKQGETSAAKLLSTTLTGAFILFGAPTILTYLVAPLFVPWLGLEFDEPTKELLIHLARILAPLFFLQAGIGLLSSILNAHQAFAFPAFAPMAVTIAIIGFLIFGRSLGIDALAWGTIFGFLTCLLLVVFGLFKQGVKYRPRLDLKDLSVQRIAALSWPMFLGSTLAHANIYVDQVMASALQPGSVAALNYANKLYEVPLQLFILSLSTAVFPFFSRQAAEEDFAGLKDSFGKSVRMAAFVLLPLSALMVALAYPLVKVFFQRGAFDEQAALMTSQALAFYAIGLFPLAYAFLITRVYNSLQDAKTLRNVAFMNLFLNAGLNLLFMQFWAHAGIALSTSVTYIISGLVLHTILARKRKGLETPALGVRIVKMATAASVGGVAAALAYLFLLAATGSAAAAMFPSAGIGLLLYLALASCLQIQELGSLRMRLRDHLGKLTSPAGGCP